MQVRTRATLAGIAAVLLFFAAGVGVGAIVRARIDHDLGSIGVVVLFAAPMYQVVLAPFVYLGVRSIVAPNVAFSYTTYSRGRVRIDGRDHLVERATGTGQSSIARRTGVIMLSVTLALFVIGSLLFYAFRNSIG